MEYMPFRLEFHYTILFLGDSMQYVYTILLLSITMIRDMLSVTRHEAFPDYQYIWFIK